MNAPLRIRHTLAERLSRLANRLDRPGYPLWVVFLDGAIGALRGVSLLDAWGIVEPDETARRVWTRPETFIFFRRMVRTAMLEGRAR